MRGMRCARVRTRPGEPRNMYEAHFGLRRRPFPATPDCQCWYPASGHEYALAQLLQGLQDHEGACLLTSAAGLGKTLVGLRLLDLLGDSSERAFLTHCRVNTSSGLFQSILYDLGVAYEDASEHELRLRVTDFLLKNYATGRPTVLVCDEAQHLSITLLEELRLLGNLEGPKGKAVQVVLLAQESFEAALRRPSLSAFRQRLGVEARLQPLDVHEAADYLVFHLRQAGGHPDAILSDEAMELLACQCHGIPRLLNRAAHAALRFAFQAGADCVDAEIVLEVLGRVSSGAAEETAENATSDEGPGSEAAGDGTSDRVAVLNLGTTARSESAHRSREPEEESTTRRLFAAPKRPA